MTGLIGRARRRVHRGEGGFTLVELLVASTLFLIISSMTFSIVVTGARTMKNTKLYNDLNEEARVVLNRISRELREAREIRAVTNPGGTGFSATANSSIEFDVDFDGDGFIDETASDPERLTYRYNYAEKEVELVVAGVEYPVLADNVTAFKLEFTSSAEYKYDANQDGTTTWEELDDDTTGAVGNNNNTLDDELAHIDSITISLTVLQEPHQQEYRTTIDMRNAN
jgi:prepilin-type N-terminal cleavage/methylation domain-containing protein